MINHTSREMQVKRNNEEVHIEHIMPQSKGKWGVTEEEHESHLWKLGNLVLLDFELNDEIKNSLYDKKCIEYKKSGIKMVNRLKEEYPDWDVNAIQKRQSDLYEIAKQIWEI